MGAPIMDRAVVLGGSMAGLLAARVLAEHVIDVRVVDRDDLRTSRGRRRGVPQARHIHALLPRGRQVLEELFPGLTAELIGAGVPVGDLLGDARLHLDGHRLRRAASGLTTLSLSRPLLEERVRSRVQRLTNVRFAEPCDVVGLTTSADRRRVTGVRLLRRADGSAEEVLDADVVIDAMGRGSRTPSWLETLGYRPPVEERITVDLGCTTRTYRIGPDALDGDWGSMQGPTPTRTRAASTTTPPAAWMPRGARSSGATSPSPGLEVPGPVGSASPVPTPRGCTRALPTTDGSRSRPCGSWRSSTRQRPCCARAWSGASSAGSGDRRGVGPAAPHRPARPCRGKNADPWRRTSHERRPDARRRAARADARRHQRHHRRLVAGQVEAGNRTVSSNSSLPRTTRSRSSSPA
jgi:hypothetical protein